MATVPATVLTVYKYRVVLTNYETTKRISDLFIGFWYRTTFSYWKTLTNKNCFCIFTQQSRYFLKRQTYWFYERAF